MEKKRLMRFLCACVSVLEELALAGAHQMQLSSRAVSAQTLKKWDTASHCALVGPRCSVASVANSQLHQLCANPMAFLT